MSRTPSAAERRRVRRLECALRIVAPLLDAVLYAGDRLSRLAGDGEPAPGGGPARTPIGGPPSGRPTEGQRAGR